MPVSSNVRPATSHTITLRCLMNPIALLLIAVFAIGTCEFLTDRRERKLAPKNAFSGLSRFLDDLPRHVDFVTVKNGVFRFWPRGTYAGLTYDGGISTYVIPNAARKPKQNSKVIAVFLGLSRCQLLSKPPPLFHLRSISIY